MPDPVGPQMMTGFVGVIIIDMTDNTMTGRISEMQPSIGYSLSGPSFPALIYRDHLQILRYIEQARQDGGLYYEELLILLRKSNYSLTGHQLELKLRGIMNDLIKGHYVSIDYHEEKFTINPEITTKQ